MASKQSGNTTQPLMTTLVAVVAGAATVTALSWAPRPGDTVIGSTAIAHTDDMSSGGGSATTALEQLATPDLPGRPARMREPVVLSLPELGVRSMVTTTSFDEFGGVAVPEDVTVTGWFDGSRRLGARRGATVIVGHRDSRIQGAGSLFGIEDLPVGAPIRVTDRGGTSHAFVVKSVELIDKTRFADEATRIFTREGPYHLTLITCGGEFDPEVRSYESNVIVTAAPSQG